MENIKNEDYIVCPRCKQEVYKESIICPFCKFGIMAWLDGKIDENGKLIKQGKSENNHDIGNLQMLKDEVSESEYQNAQYEAEKKKHMSYWLMIIAPFIMILAIFIFYYCFYR